MIKVYKASAGSGKTETLAKEYIDILLKGSIDTFKHILAVTFTNKATEEMKDRIIELLSKDNNQKAEKVLAHILHDYSYFSITTIDRFFQQVLRAFAREIGQFASYRVELDTDSAVELAVDRMLDSLEEEQNKDLLNYLVSYAIENFENGGSNNLSQNLSSLAKRFFSEEFKVKKEEAAEKFITDRKTLEEYRKSLRQDVRTFEKETAAKALEIVAILEECNLSPSDFKYGKTSGMQQVRKYANESLLHRIGVSAPLNRLLDIASETSNWIAGGKLTANMYSACEKALPDKLKALVNFVTGQMESYCTKRIVLQNSHIFGIYQELYDNLVKVLRENGMMLLSEAPETLAKVIDGSDAPFIYERVGTRFDHFMLDEFQDTSMLQWENFKPLLQNALAGGTTGQQESCSLIVGDVKQSIYRWRGADWNILQNGLQKAFREDQLSHKDMDVNYRSCANIVEFNNHFFEFLKEQVGEISQIYQGVKQKTNKGGGAVSVKFFRDCKDEDDNVINWESEARHAVIPALQELLDRGYKAGDITILVRYNFEGNAISEELLEHNFKVRTEDSLLVSNSPAVRKLALILAAMVSEHDAELLKIAYGLEPDAEMANEFSLYQLSENIIRNEAFGIDTANGQVPYLNAFMDSVLEYQRDYGSDLAGFVKWWNETGRLKLNIAATDSDDAFRVMTIHKAKGLSADVVIIPFFYEFFGHRVVPLLWSNSASDVVPFGPIPVRCISSMTGSSFEKDCEEEKINAKIDAINTAYVAMTRAKKEMIIFAGVSDKQENGSVSDWLYQYLQESLSEEDVYEVGEKMHCEAENGDKVQEKVAIDRFVSIEMEGEQNRLQKAFVASEFFDENSGRQRGIVLHDIMAEVKSIGDLEQAVNSKIEDGLMDAAQRDETLKMLSERIAGHAEWFSDDDTILNEADIIDTSGKTYRPDRIVAKNGKTIVIDYKFGEKNQEYVRQVRKYISLLKKMNYPSPEGYIWYMFDNEIIKV
ncbi:MAG: UvrD-helicase domain-containing protein [Bacteroidales bacterium]|nr:UvrD-helicase domain-containing protein [Bacteroidales bacterium]